MADQIPAVFDRRDPRFDVNGETRWTRLDDSGIWVEGPVWLPAARTLVWSDIPNDRLLSWNEPSGTVGEFRRPSGYANGATVDAQGRLIHCQHGERRVVRTEPDGSLTVLADSFEGHPLNSPNDVVVAADGGIWFTDPDYGVSGIYEGHRHIGEQDGCHVYRLDPASGVLTAVIRDLDHPNGLAFSIDQATLYVSDSATAELWAYPVEGVTTGTGRLVATCFDGVFDGFRLDEFGRLWTSTGEGVHCYHDDGTLLAVLPLPQTVSNVCFGGARRNRLFVTATTALYAISLSVRGAPLPFDGPGYAAGADSVRVD